MEQISLASAEVTNTWPLNLSNIGGRVNSVRAMHLVEEESILHLAFSTGLYCRLDLRGQEEPATRTGLSLNSAEAGGEAASWHAQFGTSGCVGCGRCITWCPVGIDITEEVAAIREGTLP